MAMAGDPAYRDTWDTTRGDVRTDISRIPVTAALKAPSGVVTVGRSRPT
jgi:hypothetical protein